MTEGTETEVTEGTETEVTEGTETEVTEGTGQEQTRRHEDTEFSHEDSRRPDGAPWVGVVVAARFAPGHE